MCQLFKTEKFIAELTNLGSEAKWLCLERIFSNFLSCLEDLTSENMFQFRIYYVSLRIFMCINESSDYTHTFSVPDALFITQRSKMLARHILASRTQQVEERILEFRTGLEAVEKGLSIQTR
ncbi:hypothetical protein CDAR_449901 [Caerostris darwini]|uniref:Uncharacterized protein n=1 Tax=Caerostris darwini TaxID=1538125 RepID=A0AAV4QS20_9ARAC|nr:hypothetical protein CDAR_449901 [Caerostris darwini]